MLTTRQKEILSLAIELCDRRQIAVALDLGFVTVDNHLAKICERLSLPTRYVQFNGLKIGEKFVHKGLIYERVDRATDRFGGYNAQDESGRRSLVLYHTIVERK